MQRGLLGIAAAALVCALCYLALKRLASAGLPVADLTLATAAATLVLAAAATGFAVQAMLRARQMQNDLARLARSVDAALREAAASAARDRTEAREAAALISVAPLSAMRGQPATAPGSAAGNNVVPLSAPRSENGGPDRPPFPGRR